MADMLNGSVPGPGRLLSEELARRPVGSAGVVVLDGEGVLGSAGGPGPFPWASVTKFLNALAVLGQELLSPQRLPADRVAAATRPAFDGLNGVLPGFGRQEPNDWGLGFEIRGRKEPHWTSPARAPTAFGHFGRSGSFLWVDPERSLACAAAGDTPFGPWAAEAWPRLSTMVLDATGR